MAVVSAYCIDTGRLNWLADQLGCKSESEIAKELPVVIGNLSICCGDWCARGANLEA